MILFEALETDGTGVLSGWRIPAKLRARLDSKLTLLLQHPLDTVFQMEAFLRTEGDASIRKVKVKSNVQLRPLCCKGPINGEGEVTFLLRAKEVQSGWVPVDAIAQAGKRRTEIVAGQRGRKEYVPTQ